MLKNLLRAFGKASAMNAFPSSATIAIQITPDHWWNTYVAPCDGFVTVEGNTQSGEVNAAVAELSAELGSYSASSYGSARATLPVRKGQRVLIAARGEIATKAAFIPAKACQ